MKKNVNKAVIVAAGMSSRLYPLTSNLPKGLLEVGGKGLLQRSIDTLKSNGINDIAVVVGFNHEKIKAVLGDQVSYILNPFYKECNNMGSLWFAKEFVGDDSFVYLHGDIIYNPKMFIKNLEHFNKNSNDLEFVTDFSFFDEESMKVRVNSEKYLIESSKDIPLDTSSGEWIGITFIRRSKIMFDYFEQVMFKDGLNFYDTYAFTKMATDGYKLFCSSTEETHWVEIDFLKDFERAKQLFG